MKPFVLILVLAAVATLEAGSTGALVPMIKRDAKDARIIWTKLGLNSVCFEAQGDRFGLYTHKGEGRIVGAVKLQHISGRVRCATSTKAACDSLWGCDHKSSESVPLNVIITDGANNIIFPLQKYSHHGLGYYLPNTDARHSKELVFANYMDPFYLPLDGQLRIWFGQDLMNFRETDNQGKVCFNVFAHLM